MTITFAYLLLMVFAAVATVGIPVRLFQLIRGRIRAIYVNLSGTSKIVVTIGLLGLVVGALSWLGVVYVAIMVFTDDTTPRLWGGSELGMTSSVLGIVYLAIEILLSPLSIRQFQNRRAPSP